MRSLFSRIDVDLRTSVSSGLAQSAHSLARSFSAFLSINNKAIQSLKSCFLTTGEENLSEAMIFDLIMLWGLIMTPGEYIQRSWPVVDFDRRIDKPFAD